MTLSSQALKVLFNFASVVVLARLIEPKYYGLMAMVAAITGIAAIFRDFGLSTAALQAQNLTHKQQSNLFWINFAVGAGLTLIVFLLAHPIAWFYNQPGLVPVVQWLSLTYIISGASTQFRVQINRELRFVALSVLDIVPYVIGFVVAVIMALQGAKLDALIAQQIVLAVSGLVLGIIIARWRPGLPRRADMSVLLKFGGSLALTQLLSYVTRNADSIAIGRVWGPTALGSYDRAYQLMIMPLNQINTPLTRVAVPVLARLEEDKEKFIAYVRRAQLVALYATAPALGVLAALGLQVTVLLLGPDWVEAGLLVSVLAIGGIFRSLVQICFWIYVSRGMAAAQLKYFSIAQPLLTVFILLGLPWGALGVSIAHSVGFAIYWAVSLAWVGRAAELDMKPLFGDAIRAVLFFVAPAAAAAMVVSLLLASFGMLIQLLAGLLAAAIWFGIAAALSKRVRTDLGNLLGFVKLAFSRRKKD